MNEKEIAFAARSAALQTAHSIMSEVRGLVEYEVHKFAPQPSPSHPTAWANRLDRVPSLNKLAQPASNYSQIINASCAWRKGLGPRLADVWMFKHSSKEKLFVEQFGQECSVMKFDALHKKAVFNSGVMKEAGTSPWVEFAPMKGGIEEVVAKLKSKGWAVYIPENKHQLNLLDA